MSKILQFDNRSIFADIAEEIGTIRVPANSVGSNITLSLDNNNGLAENDYVVLGEIGEGRTELRKINQAVAAGTDIRIDTLAFPKEAGTKVYRLAYNKIKFFHASTVAGSKTELANKDIEIDQEFTEYVDASNSTGYAFFALYNSTTTTLSAYSSAYPYSLLTYAAKAQIRAIVEHFFGKKFEDDVFDALLTFAEDEVYTVKLWRFREKTWSFTTVIDQASYPFADYGLTDLEVVAFVTYNLDPVGFASFKENEVLNWGSIVSSNPRVAYIWEEKLQFTPAPSEAVTVVVKGWKKAPGFGEEITETDVRMPQVLAFRILQDLWAMPDPKKSAYWEGRFRTTVGLMGNTNKKQISRFAPLTRSSMLTQAVRDQIEYPSIDT